MASERPPQDDQRPLVGRPIGNRGVWLFGAVLAVAAGSLFAALEGRRAGLVSPATTAPVERYGSVIAAPPALAMPGAGYGATDGFSAPRAPQVRTFSFPEAPRSVEAGPGLLRTSTVPRAPTAQFPAFYDQSSPDAAYVRPVARPVAAAAAAPEPRPQANQLSGPRVNATRILNPATTVPQGTVVLAVLETALDSNRPGFARAVVSRDVRSFDGSRVLIQRGSRLFGEYKADLAQGQSRAFVQWQRLTRPDGVQIALDSPAADPLGRVGIGGKVNTHFLQRFAGAILQSTLDIGVGLATRSATGGTVLLGLPGSTQPLINPQTDSIKPTLTVRNGASVAVFVARDLDFASFE